MAVVLGSYFGTHLVLKMSNFPEKIAIKGDEHRLTRQSGFSLTSLRISNFREKIGSASNEHRPARPGRMSFSSLPQKMTHMFFLNVGYLHSLHETSFHPDSPWKTWIYFQKYRVAILFLHFDSSGWLADAVASTSYLLPKQEGGTFKI